MSAADAGANNVVPLTGRPVFPRVCANCCQPAHARLMVGQVFSHGEAKSVLAYHPFFCDGCIAAHRAESKSDSSVPFRRLLHGWKLWIPMLGGAWGASVTLPALTRAMVDRDGAGMMLGGGIFAFFALIALGSAAAIWRGSRHLAVKPPSSVTSSFHFSGDLSQTFEPEWHRFTLRNRQYAEQFREANRHQIWSRQRPELHRALAIRYYLKILGFVALGIAAVFWIADEFDYPLWDRLVDVVRGLVGGD